MKAFKPPLPLFYLHDVNKHRVKPIRKPAQAPLVKLTTTSPITLRSAKHRTSPIGKPINLQSRAPNPAKEAPHMGHRPPQSLSASRPIATSRDTLASKTAPPHVSTRRDITRQEARNPHNTTSQTTPAPIVGRTQPSKTTAPTRPAASRAKAHSPNAGSPVGPTPKTGKLHTHASYSRWAQKADSSRANIKDASLPIDKVRLYLSQRWALFVPLA